MRQGHVLWLAGVLALSSCSPAASDATTSTAPATLEAGALHPESGLPIIALHIKGAHQVHRFTVEVASSRMEQARGLMFRTAMAPDEGMLFPFTPPREASFWMRNTVIPLDIVFIGRDRRILNISANAVPYSEDPRKSEGIAAAVLELNGGRAAQLGIGPGDKVDW